MAVTVYENAQMSNQAYNNPGTIVPPPGWKILTTSPQSVTGYFGVAFYKDNQIVVAHRGTERQIDRTISDLWSDLQLVTGKVLSQYNSANEFVQQVKMQATAKAISNPTYSQTGHSLGATLAALIAAAYRNQATTFESLGARPILESMTRDGLLSAGALVYADANTATYNAAPNLINTANEHVGNIYRLYPPFDPTAIGSPLSPASYTYYSLQQHFMDNILAQFDPITGIARRVDEQKNWSLSGFACFVSYACNSEYWDQYFAQKKLSNEKQQEIINGCLSHSLDDIFMCNTFIVPGLSWGDPHLVTFDGLRYDFQKPGEYDLVVTEDGNLHVQVRQQLLPGSTTISLNVAVATRVNNTRIEFRLGSQGMRLKGVQNENASLFGTENSDVIIGNGGYKEIFGYDGDDQLYCGSQYPVDANIESHSIIHGGAGRDRIFGSYNSKDTNLLYGNSGDDYIEARTGNNTIYGGPDNGVVIFNSAGTVSFISSFAGFRNTFGYYIKDSSGNPVSGFIIWANLQSVAAGTIYPHKLVFPLDHLGFFLIPDGYNYSSALSGGDEVTFKQVNEVWAVFKNNVLLSSPFDNRKPPAYAFYSDTNLNSDGVEHMTSKGNKQCWRDTYAEPAICNSNANILFTGKDSVHLTNGDTIMCGTGQDIIKYTIGKDGVDLVQNFDITQDQIIIRRCTSAASSIRLTPLNGGVFIASVAINGSNGGVFVEGVNETKIYSRISYENCSENIESLNDLTSLDQSAVLFINGTATRMQNNEMRFISDGLLKLSE